MSAYIALIHKESKSDYGVSFPDFPGCVTAGRTLEEAKANAIEALALHVEGMIDDGEAIPEPSGLEAVMSERGNRDAVAFMVNAPAREVKTVRFNVTASEDNLQAVDKFAEREGYSRSGLLMKAAREHMTGFSINPHDGTVMHTSTATVWRYDENGHLSFVWSFHKLDADHKRQLTLGAERALREEQNRSPLIRGYWAGRAGGKS